MNAAVCTKLVLVAVTMCVSAAGVDGANILAITPVTSHSHSHWHRVLLTALARRGHNVTVLGPDLEANGPNYTLVLLDEVYEKMGSKYDLEQLPLGSPFSVVFFDWMRKQCQFELESHGFAKIMTYPVHFFDLIVMDVSNANECFFPLIKKLGQPPTVGTSPLGFVPWMNTVTGDFTYPSLLPHYALPYTDRMTFPQRVKNFFVISYVMFYRKFYAVPAFVEVAQQAYGRDAEFVGEVERNFSVVLVNTNPIVDLPRPMMSNVIPIGGLHINPKGSLPPDIKKFLDDAGNGAILFSLGSNIRSDKLSLHKQSIIINAFRQLPYQILWKWESETIPDLPKNVMVKKWLPQSDVLNHPNIRLFFTHAGALSVQEAVHFRVPIVGMPFFLDQKFNIHRVVHKGFGLGLDYTTLTTDGMVKQINEVLDNPKYRASVDRLSAEFRDRLHPPLEEAVFWVEYTLRHGGSKQLQSASVHMPAYQAYCIDIIAMLVSGIFLCLYLIKVSICYLLTKISRKRSIKNKQKKQ